MNGSLSSTLKNLRDAAGLSQPAAAARSGLSQSGVSRFEAGRQVPTPAQVRALCKAYRAPPDVRRELVAAAEAARAGIVATRPVLSRGNAHRIQARIARIEAASALIRGFQPCIVPGLLQTEGYMRAVFSSRASAGDVERSVAARLHRQEQVRPGQTLRYVVPEGALCWMAASPAVMAGQLAALGAHAARGVLGVIPWDRPVDVFPTHGFALHDESNASVGLQGGTQFLHGPDVAAIVELWDRLEALAVWGDRLASVIDSAASRYRPL